MSIGSTVSVTLELSPLPEGGLVPYPSSSPELHASNMLTPNIEKTMGAHAFFKKSLLLFSIFLYYISNIIILV
jgi:hypothetical protein